MYINMAQVINYKDFFPLCIRAEFQCCIQYLVVFVYICTLLFLFQQAFTL